MNRKAAVAVLLALSAGVCAQTLGPIQRLHPLFTPLGVGYAELVVRAARGGGSREVVVVWMQENGADALLYQFSTDGVSFPSVLPQPPQHIPHLGQRMDPMAGSSQTSGDLWVGGLTPPDMRIHYKEANQPIDGTSVQAVTNGDRGMLAVGPRAGQTGEVMYVVRTNTSEWIMWKRSSPVLAGDPPGVDWTEPEQSVGPLPEEGIGPSVEVLADGRLVVAYKPNADTESAVTPRVRTNSDPGVAQWTVANIIQAPDSAGGIEFIAGITSASIPSFIDVIPNQPSLAADPRGNGLVYVAFAGTTPSTGIGNPDLFIAMSGDSGETFLADNVLHLRESDLGLEEITAQFMPAITVDRYGGVNVMYYTTTNPVGSTPVVLQARFARIANFAVPLGLPPYNAALAPEFEQVSWMGDYHTIDSRDCRVYTAFASAHENQVNNIYACVVTLDCDLADRNMDDSVNLADVETFNSGYAAGNDVADVNGDCLVNPFDVAAFVEAYSQSQTP